jgi:putative NADH-flavin reductase
LVGVSRTIAVIGGGGMIGSRIVREALERGHPVTVLVRDPGKIAEAYERLRVLRCDVLDHAGLARQLDGVDVVVSPVGAARAGSARLLALLRRGRVARHHFAPCG